MSTLIAQTILHPKLSQTLALLATTLGREKVGIRPRNSPQVPYLVHSQDQTRPALTHRSRVCCSTSLAFLHGTLLAEGTIPLPIGSPVSRRVWRLDEKVIPL